MGAYIFLGPELGKKQDAVEAVRKKNPGAEEFVFYADETPAGEIADALRNQGLFAETRIVIVKNAEAVKKKEEIEILVSAINGIQPSASLILLSDENKLAAGLDNANAARQVFYEMFENEKDEWLHEFFRREGLSVSKECIGVILEMVENNTGALRRECSRIVHLTRCQTDSLAPGKTDSLALCKETNSLAPCKVVKTEDVEKWLSHNREESAFTLFSRIAAGDLSKALESLNVLLSAKESASGIMAGLSWCFRKLGDYLSLIEEGKAGDSFELKKIGLSSPKAKHDYVIAARRYDALAVETCLALTAECDTLMRSPAAALENVLMDRYILSVINAGSARAV